MRRLTAAAQILSDEFESSYGDTSCSCHINPPCGYCTHPGNPLCLEKGDENWEEVPDRDFKNDTCTCCGIMLDTEVEQEDHINGPDCSGRKEAAE